MPKLSVTVITKNEASNLPAALESVAWADEIVVVDAESTDRTVAIARELGGRVEIRPWPGYADQKNYAASIASHDWILSLDADERVTPPLADAIRRALDGPPVHSGFRMRRVAWYLGRWVRTTDWYPERLLRLYDRRAGRWAGRHVHEHVEVTGTVGELDGELHHYPYRDIADHLETIDRYSTLAARQMHERGARAGVIQLAAHPPLAFLRNYAVRWGFRDGAAGLIISAMNAYYVFAKFAKLWELNRGGDTTRKDTADRTHTTDAPMPAAR